jgi:phytoene dehydrogenase-like protein
MLGGFCSTFRRKGFIFDAATHFYPLLGNPATMTGKIVKELELETEWIKMDPVDQFHLPGMPPFTVPAEFAPYVQRLKEWFPHEAANIDAYFAELKQAYMYGLLYYFKGVSNDQAERMEKFSMTAKLDEHFSDPRLKIMMMGDAPHGSKPSQPKAKDLCMPYRAWG